MPSFKARTRPAILAQRVLPGRRSFLIPAGTAAIGTTLYFPWSELFYGPVMNDVAHVGSPKTGQGPDIGPVPARAVDLCRRVASRDLAGGPIYVVPQSRLATDMTADCEGYTAPSLDLYLRDAIGPAWHGRGPCLVVIDVALAADAHPDDFEYLVRAVVLHELAHILERPALVTDRTGVQPARIQFEALAVADAVSRPELAEQPAYRGHEARFIRTVLHLRHRAAEAGVAIAPALLCAGWRYGLSVADRYVEALGGEPARMAGALFHDILASPPPATFTELWIADVSPPVLERTVT